MAKRRRRVALVEAYADEAGNSGSNLFDPVQPWFWTGTLVSHGKIQSLGGPVVRDLCQRLGVDELHAAELGLPNVETIAGDVQALLESVNARFLFTSIEKAHVASTKLVDTVLDSGTNNAVSTMHYGFRGLRLPLAHVITECMTRRDQVEFWEAYRTRSGELFRNILRRIDARFRAQVEDRRLKEILGDAFAWAIQHPEDVLDCGRDEGDAPNMIAFSMIIDGIHSTLGGTDAVVQRFVHDEQEQFGQFMKFWFSTLRHITDAGTSALSFMGDLRKIDVIRCDIELASSKSEPGLQLIDIVLWLYKRSLRDSLRAQPRCTELLDFIIANATQNEFSRSRLAEEARTLMAEIAAIDVSGVDPARSHALGEELERQRLERMGIDLRRSS